MVNITCATSDREPLGDCPCGHPFTAHDARGDGLWRCGVCATEMERPMEVD